MSHTDREQLYYDLKVLLRKHRHMQSYDVVFTLKMVMYNIRAGQIPGFQAVESSDG